MAYSLHEAAPDDITGMTDVWFKSFNNSFLLSVCPDNASGRNWNSKSWEMCMKDPSKNCLVVVMKDHSTPENKIVAFARYFLFDENWKEDWKERWWPEPAEGVSEELVGDGFLTPMARQHRVAMGRRPHYFLEVLATHENYRGLGLGAKLIEWGCKKADEDGLEMYLDAGEKARPLYERWGYVVQPHTDGKASSAPMRREARKEAVGKRENGKA
ncbi:acyl-CoA N-acyltransferase [Acephala macrosclerotiorum]|nr:acyl-CoA N-acyltransferase [Acephala macrosclerotiorum]